MENNLENAILKEMITNSAVNDKNKKLFCRNLLGRAYSRNDDGGYVSNYVKTKSRWEIEEEIKNIASITMYNAHQSLNIEALLSAAAEGVFYVRDFQDALDKTITYNVILNNKKDFSYSEIKEMTNQIIDELFNKGNINVFSSKNGTRDYVLNVAKRSSFSNGALTAAEKQNIIRNIKTSLKIDSNDEEYILNELSNRVSSNWYSKNNKENFNYSSNIENEIKRAINQLNVNNNLKNKLLNDLENGNLINLTGLVPDELLSEYQEYYNNKKDSNYSKQK